MRKLVAGNWKMHGTRRDAAAWVEAMRAAPLPDYDWLVCPPATLVAEFARLLEGSGIAVGGQDCHAAAGGAHTGDISAAMLRDAGATAVILGHSERRTNHGETDGTVHAKVSAALAAGLLPIVCVGETAAERRAGHAHEVVARQMAGSLPDGFAGVVAYEPIWAIGTGMTPTLQEVGEIHTHIRRLLGPEIRILYGGSVKPDNAAALFAVPEVEGGLIGGASLSGADFRAIGSAAR